MNFTWDGVRSEREVLIRRMLFDDPRKVLKDYEIRLLRETFLKYIHRFDERNVSFWSLVLEVSDEEIAKARSSNFREAGKVWNY
ncbi:MAG: hypothetical protein GXO18_00515 [Aquificae bacterium]|nr:hypothetical protein [Aquificota bacterium]